MMQLGRQASSFTWVHANLGDLHDLWVIDRDCSLISLISL
jgi:hypothetical protein